MEVFCSIKLCCIGRCCPLAPSLFMCLSTSVTCHFKTSLVSSRFRDILFVALIELFLRNVEENMLTICVTIKWHLEWIVLLFASELCIDRRFQNISISAIFCISTDKAIQTNLFGKNISSD